MSNYLVGLDIGTRNVKIVISEENGGYLEVIGAGSEPSTGVDSGVVVDPRKATVPIKKAVQRAEGVSGTKVESVYAGISGEHIETFESYGTVSITRNNKKITERDIERVVKAAQPKEIPSDKKVIQTDLKQYVVDGQVGISDPIGMVGNRLEVYQHVVTGSITAVLNLMQAIENTGLEVEQIFLNSLASARAVLTRSERNQGVALMDIGGGVTDLTIFEEGRPTLSTALPISGGDMTRDIAIVLTLPFEEAERIKMSLEEVGGDQKEAHDQIEVTTVGGESKTYSHTYLTDIIGPRWEELFNLTIEKINNKVDIQNLPLGIVLTGGATKIDNIERFLQDKYEIPVRRGQIVDKVKGLSEIVKSPAYTTAIGLTICGCEHHDFGCQDRTEPNRYFEKAINWLNKKFKS